MNHSSTRGFAVPYTLASMLIVGLIAGSAFQVVLNGTRTAATYSEFNTCRLSAQSALDREVAETARAFSTYFWNAPATFNVLGWFDTYSATSIGTAGYDNPLPQNETLNGCSVTVTLVDVQRSPIGSINQTARLTLRASATSLSSSGAEVTKAIQEIVELGLDRSGVFDYAYFVNNFGWFYGNTITANGNIRANGNFAFQSAPLVNGDVYAAINDELKPGANGDITGDRRFQSISDYWLSNIKRGRPTSPYRHGGPEWLMGYTGKSALSPRQDPLQMPFLGDLQYYRNIAQTGGSKGKPATIKQNGKMLAVACYNDPGPSGITNGADHACLVLDGSTHPIEIDGPVVVNGDVIIKGTVKGQGTIYAGRNIHIVGDLQYDKAPNWPKPDSSPEKTAENNMKADLLGLAAKGNIVIGNYTDLLANNTWYNDVDHYIGPSFVKPYKCDPTDASIGYPSVFDGNYRTYDGGEKIKYVYNKKTKIWEIKGTSDRKYYESTVGDYLIHEYAGSKKVSRIDGVLYNNHCTMGRTGGLTINGALICRDEAMIFTDRITFNWDIRIGSFSRDAVDFSIFLPVVPMPPRLIEWQEVEP